MYASRDKNTAEGLAVKHNLFFGFHEQDKAYYVGRKEELELAGVLTVLTPRGSKRHEEVPEEAGRRVRRAV